MSAVEQAMKFIGLHQREPDMDTADAVAIIQSLLTDIQQVTQDRDAAEKTLRWNREKDYCDWQVNHYKELLDKVTAQQKEMQEKLAYVADMGLHFGIMTTSDRPEGFLAHTWSETSDHQRMFREWADSIGVSAENKRLRAALTRIEKWFGEFPPTGQIFNGTEMSYAACFGSNGERDYMRSVAREALAGKTKESPEEWVMHILGPDDVVAQPDEMTALRMTNEFNKGLVAAMTERDPNDPFIVAVAKNLATETA